MKRYNFKTDVILNKDNFLSTCPIKGIAPKRKKIDGKYIYEKFYKIDFYSIKKDYYLISSFGRVFSLVNNIELKYYSRKRDGYTVIRLQTENGSKIFPVHCLVARAFIPKTTTDKKLNRLFVHHKNWDNEYNYQWNLEWRSQYEISIIKSIQTRKEYLEENDLIKYTCKLLEMQTPIVDIFEILDKQISKEKISKIKNRQLFTIISSDYRF